MADMMNALVKTERGAENLVYQKWPIPKAGPGDLVVKIHACGICSSDLHIDNFLIRPPFVLGHEFSGTVAEVGEGVTDFQVGDPVVSITAVETCEECEWCRQGLRMHCDDRYNIGTGRDGGFAEYMLIPAKQAFHVPEGVSLDTAALCEPLACVVRGVVERTNVRAGDYVLVAGCGVMGQLTAMVAKLSGAIVFMTGLSTDTARLEVARRLGVTATFASDEVDVEEEIKRLTDGMGVDVAFECTGVAAGADICVRALRKMGTFTQIALYSKKTPFDWDLAMKKEIQMTTSIASERTSWLIALRLLKHGLISPEPLVGTPLKLSQWKEGWRRMLSKEDFKILLYPDHD